MATEHPTHWNPQGSPPEPPHRVVYTGDATRPLDSLELEVIALLQLINSAKSMVNHRVMTGYPLGSTAIGEMRCLLRTEEGIIRGVIRSMALIIGRIEGGENTSLD